MTGIKPFFTVGYSFHFHFDLGGDGGGGGGGLELTYPVSDGWS